MTHFSGTWKKATPWVLCAALSAAFLPSSARAELPILRKLKARRLRKQREQEWKKLEISRDIPLGESRSPLSTLIFATAGESYLSWRQEKSESWIRSMELIRRSYHSLPPLEREHFVQLMKAQYQSTPNETEAIFFYGYTQLVFYRGKGAMRLLKLSEERLHSPTTALAYAIALADQDILKGRRSYDFTFEKMQASWAFLDVLHRSRSATHKAVMASYQCITNPLLEYSSVYRQALTPERQPASQPFQAQDPHAYSDKKKRGT